MQLYIITRDTCQVNGVFDQGRHLGGLGSMDSQDYEV